MQQLHIHRTLALCVHSCAYTLACACVCTFMLFLLIPIYTNVQWYKLCSEHQNDQTQEQFLPPSNPSHEHLTLTWNTQHYFTIFIHHTYIYNIFYLFFSISNLHVRPVHTWLSVLHSVFAILYIDYLYICILFFCCLCPVLLLSFCCTVELCHYNKFLVCVNIPGQ